MEVVEDGPGRNVKPVEGCSVYRPGSDARVSGCEVTGTGRPTLSSTSTLLGWGRVFRCVHRVLSPSTLVVVSTGRDGGDSCLGVLMRGPTVVSDGTLDDYRSMDELVERRECRYVRVISGGQELYTHVVDFLEDTPIDERLREQEWMCLFLVRTSPPVFVGHEYPGGRRGSGGLGVGLPVGPV